MLAIGREDESADRAVKVTELPRPAARQVDEPDLRVRLDIQRIAQECQRAAIGTEVWAVIVGRRARQLHVLAAVVTDQPDVPVVAIRGPVRRAERIGHPTSVRGQFDIADGLEPVVVLSL